MPRCTLFVVRRRPAPPRSTDGDSMLEVSAAPAVEVVPETSQDMRFVADLWPISASTAAAEQVQRFGPPVVPYVRTLARRVHARNRARSRLSTAGPRRRSVRRPQRSRCGCVERLLQLRRREPRREPRRGCRQRAVHRLGSGPLWRDPGGRRRLPSDRAARRLGASSTTRWTRSTWASSVSASTLRCASGCSIA